MKWKSEIKVASLRGEDGVEYGCISLGGRRFFCRLRLFLSCAAILGKLLTEVHIMPLTWSDGRVLVKRSGSNHHYKCTHWALRAKHKTQRSKARCWDTFNLTEHMIPLPILKHKNWAQKKVCGKVTSGSMESSTLKYKACTHIAISAHMLPF